MYENFSEYWEDKKEVLEKLGVTKEVAKLIWGDAVDCVMFKMVARAVSK